MKKKNSKKSTSKETIMKKKYSSELIQIIQPQGGLSFKDERYIKAGDGYEACLHIYQYPKFLDTHWLSTAINLNNIVAILDIATDDMFEVKRNINKSMKEHSLRHSASKDITEARDAEARYQELDRMYQEISQLGEIVKLIHLRLFVAAKTVSDLDNEVKKVQTYLESNGYKSAIFLNESKNEWQAMYQSYSEQQKNEFRRYGQPLLSEALGGGNPFHFTSLSDPHGTYMGTTVSTGGSVLFDLFTISKTRLSYNALCIGKMGTGKSTTLKKLMLDMSIRGHYIRGFDPTGEFSTLTDYLGGKTVSLDGTDGILNALEILKTDESESINFTRHISKMSTIYRFLISETNEYEIIEFEQILKDFYINFGLVKESTPLNNQKITGLSPNSYPIFSDFLVYLDELIQKASARGAVQTELTIVQMKRYTNIRLVISNLVTNYGYMFNGHSSIDNIMDTQIVFFNIKNLANIKSEIFDAQIFSALSLCWNNCVTLGSRMKNLYDTQKIEWADITRFMIFIDEAHRIINANKLHAVEQLVTFEREARKYFGGLMYASQSIRDFIPEGAKNESIDKIKVLFELTQYKFIMQQDSNTLDLLNRVFHGELTSSELTTIPKLQKGECILSIASDKSIHFGIEITKEENLLFRGGA